MKSASMPGTLRTVQNWLTLLKMRVWVSLLLLIQCGCALVPEYKNPDSKAYEKQKEAEHRGGATNTDSSAASPATSSQPEK
jgi:hypothetical protein